MTEKKGGRKGPERAPLFDSKISSRRAKGMENAGKAAEDALGPRDTTKNNTREAVINTGTSINKNPKGGESSMVEKKGEKKSKEGKGQGIKFPFFGHRGKENAGVENKIGRKNPAAYNPKDKENHDINKKSLPQIIDELKDAHTDTKKMTDAAKKTKTEAEAAAKKAEAAQKVAEKATKVSGNGDHRWVTPASIIGAGLIVGGCIFAARGCGPEIENNNNISIVGTPESSEATGSVTTPTTTSTEIQIRHDAEFKIYPLGKDNGKGQEMNIDSKGDLMIVDAWFPWLSPEKVEYELIVAKGTKFTLKDAAGASWTFRGGEYGMSEVTGQADNHADQRRAQGYNVRRVTLEQLKALYPEKVSDIVTSK
jgi:hypothetical protein